MDSVRLRLQEYRQKQAANSPVTASNESRKLPETDSNDLGRAQEARWTSSETASGSSGVHPTGLNGNSGNLLNVGGGNREGTLKSRSLLSRIFSLDVLDSLPFRLWRQAYARNHRLTIITTLLVYTILQSIFIWLEFGLVFLLFSFFLVIALSLGQRNEDEMSAYSVFNPNCERLLGQMTAEHFERDVLQQRR